MNRWAGRLLGAALVALGAMGYAMPARAQAPTVAPPAALPGDMTPSAVPSDLEPYVDGLVAAAMETHKIAGVGVAVVRDGQVLLLKGYGQADAAGRPVDPARTLFRIASISKTFTWIALMQQVEAGRIDLDKPANDYLPPALRIPDAPRFAQPVLVRHLLTHSAGFEDLVAGHLFIADPERAVPLVDALVRYRPARVRAPGVASVYSNYGVALAGALVAHIADTPFEDYVEQRILTPLGLQNTTFREPYAPGLVQFKGLPSPMSPALAGDVSTGFAWIGGTHTPQPFEHVVQFAPAGSASATPADMARYMIALTAGGAGVLRPETVALFARPTPLFANAPGVNGVAFGMLQAHSKGGWRQWGHGGDTLRFHSELALYPDLGLGVFVATNSATGGALRDLLPGHVADRIGGRNPAAVRPAAASLSRDALRRFAGVYIADRRGYTTIEKAFCLVRCAVEVAVAPDSETLIFAGGGYATRLAPIDSVERAPGVRVHRFRVEDSGEIAAFEERGGRIVRYIHAGGVNRATRVSRFAAPQGFFAVLLLGILGAMAAGASGVARLIGPVQSSAAARLAGLLMPLAGAGWLLTLGFYGAYFGRAAGDEWTVFAHWPGVLRLGALSALTSAVITALATISVAIAWRRADWSIWRRARILATLGALVALAVALHAWNLLGARV
ncbi:MAG: serine hydrolase domain-containing protein [Hyphomonadaceae bacterium]|nr:serine hydrolase domain-containing protein [Hyphomonadaceae bacterium]